MDILRELVELRRLKAQYYVGYLDDRHEDDGYWKDAEAERQYKERKPKAWAAAEALIDGDADGSMTDKDDNDEVLYALRMAIEHDAPHQAQALRTWMQRIEQWHKDAERYRWLRANAKEIVLRSGFGYSPIDEYPSDLDQALDEARLRG